MIVRKNAEAAADFDPLFSAMAIGSRAEEIDQNPKLEERPLKAQRASIESIRVSIAELWQGPRISTFIDDLAAGRLIVSRVPGGHRFLPNRRRGVVDLATRAENASAGVIAAIVRARRRRLAFSNETDQDTNDGHDRTPRP
jgi:hypothetical protein